MTDETLPPPFGELSREEKLALVTGYYCEDRPVQFWNDRARVWEPTFGAPAWYPIDRYRLAPEPEIPDSIDWDHVAEGFDIMTRGYEAGSAWLHSGVLSTKAHTFASYKRGNMPSCTVRRPK